MALVNIGAASLAVSLISVMSANAEEVRIGYIGWSEPQLTLSLVEMPIGDEGIAGAQLAVDDNNTTGQFTNQSFSMEVKMVATVEDAVAAADAFQASGVSLLLADLPADAVLAVAEAAADGPGLVFNVSAHDDVLRAESCRANLVHTTPSYAMLADGLAQYLAWKRWDRLLLLSGALEQDRRYAEALKRSAKKFGLEIVEERIYSETDTARRTDSGHVQIQRQMPVFTQNAPDHDVVLVADESEIFGTYVPYRTWDPRPVAGSAGLIPTSWSPSMEQWGGIQLHSRFAKKNDRPMRPQDMDAWTAVRIIGEAATRAKSVEPAVVADYIRSPDLSVAAFKGQKLTIRPWDNQLRQPVLLTDTRSVISVSPQEGFLHRRTELDTLGVDEPETDCRF